MKILLATDGSKCSDFAASFLARLPHRERIDVHLVTAVAPPGTAFFAPTREFMDRLVRDDRELAERHLRSTAEAFQGANADVQTAVVDGDPRETIVHYAKENGVDLIVIGARGHSQVDRILLGSTSDFVATHAHCSVLVVRPPEQETSDHSTLRVALAYDASVASQQAIDEMLKFDWGPHTEITVVGVAGFSPIFDPAYGFNPKSIQAEAEMALTEASRALSPRVSKVASKLIDYDHVAEGLVQFTESNKSDLIVIGDTGRSNLSRALLGSVSRFVLRHAHCGVWITRGTPRPQPEADSKAAQGDKLAGAT